MTNSVIASRKMRILERTFTPLPKEFKNLEKTASRRKTFTNPRHQQVNSQKKLAKAASEEVSRKAKVNFRLADEENNMQRCNLNEQLMEIET